MLVLDHGSYTGSIEVFVCAFPLNIESRAFLVIALFDCQLRLSSFPPLFHPNSPFHRSFSILLHTVLLTLVSFSQWVFHVASFSIDLTRMDTAMLQCIICPGQPRFSDASHLLTHVASKAHLSFYFKLQVRSHQETDATQLLEEYDNWYNTNGLAQLLSERMTSKEDRKKRRKPQPKSAANPPPQHTQRVLRGTSSKTKPSVPSAPNADNAPNSFPEYLDPRLADAPEQTHRDLDPTDAPFHPRYDTPTQLTITGDPAVKLEDASLELELVPTIATFTHNGTQEGGRVARDIWPSIPQTPRTPRPRTRRGGLSSTAGHGSLDPFLDAGMPTSTPNEFDADKNRTDEMARLKGIQWPGMDLFDSATQQMRRKRNQKKDGNVLRMMERTSLQVEPTELIFSPSGILRKERVISGNVEDDSPLKGETPIPKRRLPRPKKGALRQVDSNVRAQDRKRAKKASNSTDERNGLASHDNDLGPRQHNGGIGIARQPFEGDDEMSIAVQAFGRRTRSGFTIFADGVDQDKLTHKDHAESSKVSLDTLTPTRLTLSHKPESSVHAAGKHEPAVGKENIEPMMTRTSVHGWRSPFPRSTDTDNIGYAPRYYYDESSHSHFSSNNDLDSIPYRANPLLAPFPRTGFYDISNSYVADMGMSHLGWAPSPRVASSEATISEEDNHDFAQLYLATPVD